MAYRARITPNRLTALQAKIGIVVASLFLAFGLVMAVVIGMETSGSEPGLLIAQAGFLLIWIAACVSIIAVFARLLSIQRNPEASSLLEARLEDAEDSSAPRDQDFDFRLRKLERLKADGLITEKEYKAKRRRILDEKW